MGKEYPLVNSREEFLRGREYPDKIGKLQFGNLRMFQCLTVKKRPKLLALIHRPMYAISKLFEGAVWMDRDLMGNKLNSKFLEWKVLPTFLWLLNKTSLSSS